MKSVIITIGDEILIGQVVNTNAAFIAEKLNEVGIEVIRIVTIGDNETAIINTFMEHYHLYDVIVVTGGLGPTHDDVTRNAVCKFFKKNLLPNEQARAYIKSFLLQRNYPWSEAAENQTLVPEGATVIPNRFGTAVGELFENENKYFIVLPGVPYEMESMMSDYVVPFFQSKKQHTFIIHRTLMTTGIPESVLASRLGNIDDIVHSDKLAFLPAPTGVRLRISVSGSDKKQCEKNIQAIESLIREKVGDFIYGVDDEQLESVIGKLLSERNLKIAIAESCTGGMISDKLTNIPGSSRYFERSVVTYSNKSKIDLLNITKEMIDKYGAVSKEVAEAMADGIRKIACVDIGISTTGIAGPEGGTKDKPIGLVWIGFADVNQTFAQQYHLGGGRLQIKERATQAAMDLIRRNILKIK